MNVLLSAIEKHAQTNPKSLALKGSEVELSYADLLDAVKQTSLELSQNMMLGIALDNDPAWAVADLAAMSLDIPVVPLPHFFSPKQIAHAINDAGINSIICDQAIAVQELLTNQGLVAADKTNFIVAGKMLTLMHIQNSKPSNLPTGTSKVTYTSGTTGSPKGVCLSNEAMLAVASSLQKVTHASKNDRHLSILPLSTLLENIAGVYVPLLAGASCHLLSASEVGLTGATGLDLKKMMQALHLTQASTTVLTPELLRALIMAIEAGMPKPSQLRFIAVGGASVSPRLLKRAADLSLPVFEGYGLSECASVVALNTEDAACAGSVGKALPHASVKIAEDGEILVKGACLLGYSNSEQALTEDFYATGDIGHIDVQGFLHITGRKKNMFITSFGRNVAPEWVERELCLMPGIAQAALFGEAQPFNVALIVPGKDSHGNIAQLEDINQAVAEVNQQLPDYARVKRWLFAQSPFTPHNGQLTPNARLKRDIIWQQYAPMINAMYEETNDVVL